MTRDELLALIDQAEKEGWTELDLSSRGLTELPPEIGRLSELNKLDLSNNELTELPPEIFNLSNLQTLILGDYRGDTMRCGAPRMNENQPPGGFERD